MEKEIIEKLLELVNTKQYIDATRYLEQHNKRIRISGFSPMEKAPRKLLANKAKTDKKFKQALLKSFADTIFITSNIDLSKSVEELKSAVPHKEWLGLAAAILLSETQDCVIRALGIIESYNEDEKSVADVSKVQSESKTDRKEEKFREKYLKCKNEIAQKNEELNFYKTQLQDFSEEINKLKINQKNLEKQNIAYLAQLDALNKDNDQLRKELEKVKAEMEAISEIPVTQAKLDICVVAPYCKDILGKYKDLLSIEFGKTTNVPMSDVFTKYDEIWVFPDVIPFAEYRILRKWKKQVGEKVRIFETVTALVQYADRIIQHR